MDENLVKGFKLKTGDVYKYDYESLGNKPFYDIITVGDVIIPETTCYFDEYTNYYGGSFEVPSSVMQYPFENGENYLLYIDDNTYIIYKSVVPDLIFSGLYDGITLKRLDSEFIQFEIDTTLNIVGEHVVKLCAIASEDKKSVGIKDSIILKSVTSEAAPYFVTDKNLSCLDLTTACISFKFDGEFFTMHVVGASEFCDGTIKILAIAPIEVPGSSNNFELKYNPDSGIAIWVPPTGVDMDHSYNVYANATPGLTADSFTAATLHYDRGK